MNDDDDDKIISATGFLTVDKDEDLEKFKKNPVDVKHPANIHDDYDVDWSGISEMCQKADPPSEESRWITAIQKVSPKSGSFWFQYAEKRGEKAMLQISKEVDRDGFRWCDVLIYTRRSVADVVLTAWNEYNEWLGERS